MDYLKNINDFINESIKICDYKKWVKYFNWEKYKQNEKVFKKFKTHDKNYNRIYFPLKIEKQDTKLPQEIKDYLSWNNYSYDERNNTVKIKSYNDKGIYYKNIKLGKFLKMINQYELLDIYKKSKDNILKNKDDLMVVISRHPYDLIGISTGRGWTTCLNLDDNIYGKNHLYNLKNFLTRGYMVAYLIKQNDKNIENPISRILIEDSHGYLYANDKIYGTYVKEFKNLVDEWVYFFMHHNKINFEELVYIKDEINK